MFVRNWIKMHEKIGPEKYQPYEGSTPKLINETVTPPKGGTCEGKEPAKKIDDAVDRIGNCIITHNINRVDFLSTSGLNTAELAIKSILKDVYGDE